RAVEADLLVVTVRVGHAAVADAVRGAVGIPSAPRVRHADLRHRPRDDRLDGGTSRRRRAGPNPATAASTGVVQRGLLRLQLLFAALGLLPLLVALPLALQPTDLLLGLPQQLGQALLLRLQVGGAGVLGLAGLDRGVERLLRGLLGLLGLRLALLGDL